ncbi:MAG: DNA-processing protein DprA [Clostridiaceae bacterium]
MDIKLLGFWLSTGNFSSRERMELKGEYEKLLIEYKSDARGLPIEILKKKYFEAMEAVDGFIVPGEELFDRVFGRYPDKPCGLFYRGDIGLLESRCITFAGSRKASNYGVRATREIITSLKDLDIAIVSGGALGIDSVAHSTALDIGLKTICVLGCGVNHIYPPQNRELFLKIVMLGGLIISEYLPFKRPEKYYFPERNRIMAQLGELLIIPEATEISGSLHTATCADSYGKRIVTIPHEIFSISGKGCNSLISMGADILSTPGEILNYV